MLQTIREKKQAFTDLSAVQRKIADCIVQRESNRADADKSRTRDHNLHKLRLEWDGAYNKYAALEWRFTELVRISLSKKGSF